MTNLGDLGLIWRFFVSNNRHESNQPEVNYIAMLEIEAPSFACYQHITWQFRIVRVKITRVFAALFLPPSRDLSLAFQRCKPQLAVGFNFFMTSLYVQSYAASNAFSIASSVSLSIFACQAGTIRAYNFSNFRSCNSRIRITRQPWKYFSKCLYSSKLAVEQRNWNVFWSPNSFQKLSRRGYSILRGRTFMGMGRKLLSNILFINAAGRPFPWVVGEKTQRFLDVLIKMWAKQVGECVRFLMAILW